MDRMEPEGEVINTAVDFEGADKALSWSLDVRVLGPEMRSRFKRGRTAYSRVR